MLLWMPRWIYQIALFDTASKLLEPVNDIDEEIIPIDGWEPAQKAIDASREPDLDPRDEVELRKLSHQGRNSGHGVAPEASVDDYSSD